MGFIIIIIIIILFTVTLFRRNIKFLIKLFMYVGSVRKQEEHSLEIEK